jgi:cytolysin-activating lysine-acyltransferase
MGQLTLAMLRLARYKGLSIADLDTLALQPLLNDRVAFAHGESEATSAMPLGMAIWASVSDAVSARIAEQVNAGMFPLRLGKDEWASGDNVWLLDIVVPTKRAGTSVFMNFGSLIGGRSFRMHPVVLQSVDRSIVDKISGLGQSKAEDATTTH